MEAACGSVTRPRLRLAAGPPGGGGNSCRYHRSVNSVSTIIRRRATPSRYTGRDVFLEILATASSPAPVNAFPSSHLPGLPAGDPAFRSFGAGSPRRSERKWSGP